MRTLTIVAGALLFVMLAQTGGAYTLQDAYVTVSTDAGSWTSSPTTIDDGTFTEFTISGSTLALDTATDAFTSTQSVGPCTVDITVNGQVSATLTCFSGGIRQPVVADGTTYAAGFINSAVIATYDEAFRSSPNSLVNYQHKVLVYSHSSGELPQLVRSVTATNKQVGTDFFVDTGISSYNCLPGNYVVSQVEIWTSDGWSHLAGQGPSHWDC